MNTTKAELDHRVEAALTVMCADLSKTDGYEGKWPDDTPAPERVTLRAMMTVALAAADAARPAMTAEDEERAVEIMVEDIWTLGKPSLGQQFADVVMVENALNALRREFDVTPRAKTPPPDKG